MVPFLIFAELAPGLPCFAAPCYLENELQAFLFELLMWYYVIFS